MTELEKEVWKPIIVVMAIVLFSVGLWFMFFNKPNKKCNCVYDLPGDLYIMDSTRGFVIHYNRKKRVWEGVGDADVKGFYYFVPSLPINDSILVYPQTEK